MPSDCPYLVSCSGDPEHQSEHRTDWDETQSARNETPNRPTSSSGPYPTGGPVGGGANNATAPTIGYATGQSENATNILSSAHALDTQDDHGVSAYGYPSAMTAGHNGIGGEGY